MKNRVSHRIPILLALWETIHIIFSLSFRLTEFSGLILFLLKFRSEMAHTEETHKYDLFEQNEQFLLFTFISVTVWNTHTCISWLHSIENNLFHQLLLKIPFKPRKGFVILIWCCCRLCVCYTLRFGSFIIKPLYCGAPTLEVPILLAWKQVYLIKVAMNMKTKSVFENQSVLIRQEAIQSTRRIQLIWCGVPKAYPLYVLVNSLSE